MNQCGEVEFHRVQLDLPGFEDRGEKAFRSWLSIKAESKVREKFRKDLFRGGGRREVTMVQGDRRGCTRTSACLQGPRGHG